MARTQKPRPKSQRELLDEAIGYTTADPTSDRSALVTSNRGNDVSTKGDRVKDVSIGIVDIDTAIIKYIEEKIKPSITQDSNRIQVPVMYGFPERWQTIQEKGALREISGRFLAPVIVIKRDSLEANRTLGTKIDANNPQNLHVFESGYTKKNQYDNFAVLSNRDPIKEYRLVVTPEYVTLKYSLVIFTNHLEQNNKIIEAFQYASNTYWGEQGKFQFRTNIDSFSTSTEYSAGEDRTTRTTFGITLNGYIIPDTVNRDISYPKKFLSKAQIVFNLETDDLEIFTVASKPKNTVKKQGVNFPEVPQAISVSNTSDSVVQYLGIVTTKTGGDLYLVNSSTIRVVGSTILPAPPPLPPTDKSQFIVVINTTYLPNNVITSVSQNGTDVDIVINTTTLGYGLTNTNGIAIIGKLTQ
jgi:hypothetical protein